MSNIYHWIGFIVFWIAIIALIGFLIFGIRVIGYLISRTKRYQSIKSWVWFYILRKNLPTENIRHAYKNYGYWKYAAKYRLRNIKKLNKKTT